MEEEVLDCQSSSLCSTHPSRRRRSGGRSSDTQRIPDIGEASGFEALDFSGALEGEEETLEQAAANVLQLALPISIRGDPNDDEEANIGNLVDAEHVDACADIESDIESDIGDEDIIEGPDNEYIDEEEDDLILDELSFGLGRRVSPPMVVLDEACVARFEKRLSSVIEGLQKWTERTTWDKFWQAKDTEEGSAMTRSFWELLRKVSHQFLMDMYCRAIPPYCQVVLGKAAWTYEDFLSLPDNWDLESRKGVYGNFPFSHGAPSNDGEHECCVGSSLNRRGTRARILVHVKRSSLTLMELVDNKDAHSAHYQYTCRTQVECNFRILAAFDNHSIPKGYVFLLEGIFMILLRTYNNPGYTSRWTSLASYVLVKEISDNANLPAMKWKGLNRAWPLCQGFRNGDAHTASPCEHCNTMTQPAKHTRYLANSEDPLGGGYHCQRCYVFRRDTGRLPIEEELRKRQIKSAAITTNKAMKKENAANSVTDPTCSNPACDQLQSEHERPFRTITIQPGGLYCGNCVWNVETHGSLRTEIEVRTCRLKRDVSVRRNEGLAYCHFCLAISNRFRGGITVIKAGFVLCQQCKKSPGGPAGSLRVLRRGLRLANRKKLVAQLRLKKATAKSPCGNC
ncbi:hypothetical protein BKA61DRAFT_717529 [Leptodontidium sp. MPI-SDFR-AT-0119]|nr:hypothetical protein BKA61DRAFT_717529 [Leptodontidium sp. MPI-SDFR-AT-0119]